jgi:hypothetical protein
MPKELEDYEPKRYAKPVRVSLRVRELMAAKEMGMMPHEWDMAPKASRAEMMAVLEVDNLIGAYQRDNPLETKP